MLIEHPAADRRRHDRMILQAFTVTMAGFWLTIFLYFMCILPIGRTDVWPLLELPRTATGRKAPDKGYDTWISVRANGEVVANEHRLTRADLMAALSKPYGDVFVRVDRSAPFGAVRNVVRAAREVNRRQLTFMAAPLHGADTE